MKFLRHWHQGKSDGIPFKTSVNFAHSMDGGPARSLKIFPEENFLYHPPKFIDDEYWKYGSWRHGLYSGGYNFDRLSDVRLVQSNKILSDVKCSK